MHKKINKNIIYIIICHKDYTKSEKLSVLSHLWPYDFFQNSCCNRNIFLAAISGHDWQPSWILRPPLSSILFVTTNLLQYITRINIHLKLNIVNLW